MWPGGYIASLNVHSLADRCPRRTTAWTPRWFFGPTGQGITSTVLHDATGPVGHAQQILTVRRHPASD
ncbi:hypothetical protein [Nocardiopsis sp. NRRL B-16309]|uniref:hypothetical protein n=1 Tax=Nocardiopsis sp. NRRL B-16309 TaxID=1519494 RepID=UPI001E286613|nr:hypothetical protein [Nocardiopsis sp. NRRL B-16309]